MNHCFQSSERLICVNQPHHHSLSWEFTSQRGLIWWKLTKNNLQEATPVFCDQTSNVGGNVHFPESSGIRLAIQDDKNMIMLFWGGNSKIWVDMVYQHVQVPSPMKVYSPMEVTHLKWRLLTYVSSMDPTHPKKNSLRCYNTSRLGTWKKSRDSCDQM